MNEDGGQKIFDFLMEMIQLKESYREKYTDEKKFISNESYIKDFCTIRLNAGRQVGHTTAIMKLIEHYSLQKKKILVLTPNLEYIKQLQRKMKIVGSELEKYVLFESENTFVDNSRGFSIDLVIFDMFSVSKFAKGSKEFLSYLSVLGSQNKNFMMVLLG